VVRSGRPDGVEGQQSLGELVALAAKDISTLIRYEIDLAVKELKMDGVRIAVAAASAVVGLFAGCLLLVLLCFAYAYGLEAVGAPGGLWGAFLWVSLTVVFLIAAAALIAIRFIRKVTGMSMTRKTVRDDLGMLRRSEPSPNGSGPGITNPEVGTGKGTTAEIPPARQ
jgi:putative superfamily III holin-X